MPSGPGSVVMQTTPESDDLENGRDKISPRPKDNDLLYGIDEVPAWYTCAILGLQQFLVMLSGAVGMPLVATSMVCMADDDPTRGYIVGASLFVSGITTFLQTVIGIKLPIVQGPSWTYLPPIQAVMQMPQWQCPPSNVTSLMTSEERRQLWEPRLCELMGALLVASVIQMLFGLTGAVGLLMRFISPITIVVSITMLGIGFFKIFEDMMAGYWPVSLLTLCLVVLFSQYLHNISVPFPYWVPKRRGILWVPIFKLLPILLSILIGWTVCAALTLGGFLPPFPENGSEEKKYGVLARTDANINYGAPTVHFGPVLAMTAGIIASIVESIGDYLTCAKMSGATSPPTHAMNRGIAIEGMGGVLSALFSTLNASTSYSGNIGIIGITKVASRRVIQWSAIFMVLFGAVGKFGSLFISIPTPVYGGAFVPLFGMITGMGLSSLQFIDLQSTRNMFIIGTSILISLIVPDYAATHAEQLETGNATLDQIIFTMLSTAMLLGGLIACILDNTIPGTDEERGITKWRALTTGSAQSPGLDNATYDLPRGMALLRSSPPDSESELIPLAMPADHHMEM